ncbi:MAG: hypothetical protein WBP72_02525 [Rhodocyclaceae bacterium]
MKIGVRSVSAPPKKALRSRRRGEDFDLQTDPAFGIEGARDPGSETPSRHLRDEPGRRYRSLWIAIGTMGLAALVFVHVTSHSHHLLTFHRNADKIEHILAFGAAMVWFGQLYRRGLERALFCACLILGGVALEYAQHALGHFDPVEYGDMAADAAGACLGMLVLRTRAADIISWLTKWLEKRGGRSRPSVD